MGFVLLCEYFRFFEYWVSIIAALQVYSGPVVVTVPVLAEMHIRCSLDGIICK